MFSTSNTDTTSKTISKMLNFIAFNKKCEYYGSNGRVDIWIPWFVKLNYKNIKK